MVKQQQRQKTPANLGDECLIPWSGKEMATHRGNFAWEIPWTGEPGRLQSIGSQRVRHDSETKQQQTIYSVALFTFVRAYLIFLFLVYFLWPLLKSLLKIFNNF